MLVPRLVPFVVQGISGACEHLTPSMRSQRPASLALKSSLDVPFHPIYVGLELISHPWFATRRSAVRAPLGSHSYVFPGVNSSLSKVSPDQTDRLGLRTAISDVQSDQTGY